MSTCIPVLFNAMGAPVQQAWLTEASIRHIYRHIINASMLDALIAMHRRRSPRRFVEKLQEIEYLVILDDV